MPVMVQIHEALAGTVCLLIRRGVEALCIHRIEGLHIPSMFLETGASLPLHLGVGPRVLLAATPRRCWKEYLSSEIGSYDAEDAHIERGVIFVLEEVRELGYAGSDEDVRLGVAALGAHPFLTTAGAFKLLDLWACCDRASWRKKPLRRR